MKGSSQNTGRPLLLTVPTDNQPLIVLLVNIIAFLIFAVSSVALHTTTYDYKL